MRFIPLEYLVVNTMLAPADARARLAEALEPCSKGPPPPLCGSVGRATFVLRRPAPARWVPTAEFRGRIEPRGEGTRLTGMVSVDVPPVLVLAVAAVAAFWVAAEPLRDLLAGAPAELPRLAPLALVVLAWVLTVRGVAAETRRLRRLVDGVLAPTAAGGSPPCRDT